MTARSINRRELAELLGVSVASIDRRLQAEELPHHRLAGRVFFTPQDVERILAITARPARPARLQRRAS
jgi:predicted DNA-binding transcriptional regulator AlpA